MARPRGSDTAETALTDLDESQSQSQSQSQNQQPQSGPAGGKPQQPDTRQDGPQRRRRMRPGPAKRCRAARACQKCNEKRVKCDASERGTPCTRCVDKGEPECALIQSRRGTYTRKGLRQQNARSESGSHREGGNKESNATRNCQNAKPSPEPWQLEPGHATANSAEGAESNLPAHAGTASSSSQAHTAPSVDGPSWESDASPSGMSHSSDASQYREISWSELFSHLLEDRDKGSGVVDKASITYLGESFPLGLVLKDLAGSSGTSWRKLHHPGPPPGPISKQPSDDQDQGQGQSQDHPPHMRPEDIAFLAAKNAFIAPDRPIADAFVRVFINRFYPLYPIVNRHEFIEQYKAEKTPWMLLHAVCLVAATYCPMQLIHKAGFESRREARWTFYSRTRALFDIGYEENKIVALQVSILMTFWGGGPTMYWNFYSWISTGVTLAETLGCHRSMTEANVDPSDQSLLKRLWWILVIRDTSCASLVGRPFRINLDHSDTSPLTIPNDFEPESPPVSCLYQIEASKLALILRRITMDRFSPKKNSLYCPMAMQKLLTEWRDQLPAELAWSDNTSRHPNILASCLAITYNHHMILAHLNYPPDLMQPGPSSEDMTNFAAQQIASIACGVVTRSEILTAPHEFLHGIFLAAVVFYKQTKSPQPVISQLGMSGLTNCQMVLHETIHFWDPSPWIQHILDKILATKATQSDVASPILAASESFMQMPNMSLNASQPDNNLLFPMVETMISPHGFDMWQNYPVLGNLFDLPARDPGSLDKESGTSVRQETMPWT